MEWNDILTILKGLNNIVCYETFVCFVLFLLLPKKSINNRLLLIICSIYVINEICMEAFGYYIYKKTYPNLEFWQSFSLAITGIVTNILWLFILKLNNIQSKKMPYIIIYYLIISLSICFLNDFSNFFGYVFSLGGLIYLSLYFHDSLQKIKTEQFEHLFNSKFILLSAPVFMIFGISIIFVFISREILDYKILNTDFQSVIGFYVNFISYSLFLYYGYREFKRVQMEKKNQIDI
ncbi:MAG: hypothetical protein RLZZ500_542 [Bacteroidota bacterium]